MASHAPQTIDFVTIDGLVMNSGYSTQLAKGQFGIVDKGAAPTSKGMVVTNSFSTTPKDRLFELKLGVAPLTVTRSQSNKAYSSMPFKLSEIVDIKVNAPKLGVGVDEVIIGYDGINADTAITLTNGDNEVIDITLAGEAIGMLGYADSKVTVKLYLEAPNTGTFTNQEIVLKAVERLKEIELVGGVSILNYIDVTPVDSTNAGATGQDSTFYRLTVADAGNFSALALIQAAYPTYVVKKDSYTPSVGNVGTTTYVLIAPTGTTLADYTQTVYVNGQECDGTPDCDTITTTYTWVAGETCTAVGETYKIQLKDDECDPAATLAALQAFYPNLTITADTAAGTWERTATLTGASGNASLVIGGVTYTTAFTTDLTTTAAAFVTAHAAAILTATGATVTSTGAVIKVVAPSATFPTITAVDGGLTETLSAITATGSAIAGGCQTVYQTTVYSSLVCEECDPIFTDLFLSEAPEPYKFTHWTKEAAVYDEDALMGIRLKGKVNVFAGSEEYRDSLPFVYSSTRISVSNESPSNVNESFTVGGAGRFAVKLLSIATEPEAVGGQLYDREERTRVYYENRQRLGGNNYGKLVLGQESHLKPLTHYVDYSIRIRTNRFAQSFSGEVVENFDYHIHVDACNYTAVETLVNALATAAGLPTVSAY